ncbi:PITH domain-containing protein [Aspergillus ambiguus]|uniref:thioredoxin-like protein 1 n=1 Tax=Aspergillus ambiguus TaxID=176160 RepID=UPI003CCD96EF
MSKTVHITSKEQFSSLLTSSTFVVADYWCGPCKAIAPVYEQLSAQLSRPNAITFTKINVDTQKDIASAHGITAMPTFMVFQRGRVISTIRGANPQQLSDAVRKLAAEASKADSAGPSGAAADESSNGGAYWVGAAPPKNYTDITDQHDPKGLELLNRASEFGTAKTLFQGTKPSALDAKGKGKGSGKGAAADWVESDTDEQLMLFVPFQSRLKLHSLQITSVLPDDDEEVDEDERPMRPKTLQLYTNRSHVLGFDEADDIPAVQTVTIQPEDWDPQTATAKVDLRFVKFQNVMSLVLFFVDGDGESDKLRVDRVRIFGEAGEKREMGKLEKIGDEPGE